MYVSDTRKSYQNKRACQIWSCAMEYSSSFVYIYIAPYLNNAVYINYRIAGANYDGQRPPETEDWLYVDLQGFFKTMVLVYKDVL